MPRLSLTVSEEIDDALNNIAARNGITKAEAIKRAFALLVIADQQKQKKGGFSPGIVRERERERERDDHTLEAVGRVMGSLWPLKARFAKRRLANRRSKTRLRKSMMPISRSNRLNISVQSRVKSGVCVR